MPADSARTFFDTNLLVHMLLDDIDKSRRVDGSLRAGGWISVQVLNEIANAGLRKHRMPLPRIRLFISKLRDLLQIIPVTIAIHDHGLDLIDRHTSPLTTR